MNEPVDVDGLNMPGVQPAIDIPPNHDLGFTSVEGRVGMLRATLGGASTVQGQQKAATTMALTAS